jgi:pantetheine-phosphate adenylyltransferase
MRIGLYPGTFDPVTLGHLDIIRRACSLVDRLVLGIAVNRDKGPLFNLDERVAMVERECAPIAEATGIEIVAHPFDNLLIQCAEDVGASVIVRGLRAVSDFEYEFQMAATNARLCPSIETMFLTASETNQFISSRFVKEIARLGGDVSSFVSAHVRGHLEGRQESA